MGMSTRSLQTHMAKEKLSVRLLRNKTIAEYAKTRYHRDNKSVAQIADKLGYSEPTVLSRIYKKITGSILSKDL
jgi:AraC-like DNA-binding protein